MFGSGRAAFVLLLVAAGCMSGGSDDGAPTSTTAPAAVGPRVLPWGLADCRFAVFVTGVPSAAVAPFLPDGFRSLSMQELVSPGAPNPGDQANFGAEMFECRSAAGLHENVTDGSYGSYFTGVEPPSELLNTSHALHFVKWDVLIADPALRAVLQEVGVPALEGTASFVRFLAPPIGSPADAPLVAEGSLFMGSQPAGLFDVVGLAPYPNPPGGFDEFTQVPTGLVVYEADVTWNVILAGTGLYQPPAGTLAAQILGGTNPVPGAYYVGTASFVNSKITLPV